MSPHLLILTAGRILRQLRYDRRTLAIMLLVPVLLLTLLYFLLDRNKPLFNSIALVMLGLFPFIVMFLVTSIAVLRERTSGTLERLLTTPVGKIDLLLGYGVAFGLLALVQVGLASFVSYRLLGLTTAGSSWYVLGIAVVNALMGVAMGLLLSAFARTEFQAAQFMPLVVFPQLLLCGLFVPREQMAGWLRLLSDFMPLTYSVEALQEVGVHARPTTTMWLDIGICSGVMLLALVLGAATLRRRTP